MADSKCSDSSTRSMMNPWVLHFQKLGLELKCSLWFVSLAKFIFFLFYFFGIFCFGFMRNKQGLSDMGFSAFVLFLLSAA